MSEWVCASIALCLVGMIQITVFVKSLSNFTGKLFMTNTIDFGTWGQRSRSTLALCLCNIVGIIQATEFARSLLVFTCKLLMMRGGTLLILSHWVKGQGQLWDSACESFWA